MIIRAQFIKNGKVDLAWSLFIVPETMPITEIFEGIKSGMYFYFLFLFSDLFKFLMKFEF